jgi:hypothetical protein
MVLGINGGLILILLALNLTVDPPKPKKIALPIARIGAVVGQVEVKKSGGNKWVPAKVGELLMEGDEIRTALFSESVMRLKGKSSVVVSANTNFLIGKELLQHYSFKLGVGQVYAAIPGGSDREYSFHSEGSDAVASTKIGEFSVSTDGVGTVVVDAHAGSVKLRAKDKEVSVKKGKRSVVLPDKAPSKVLPIPTSVALQVKWPPTKIDRTQTRVTGKASAGSLVLVNGILVRVDKDGVFTLDVPLREGSNRLVVSATDPAGNSATRESPEILVDTNPPDVQVDAKDLWK